MKKFIKNNLSITIVGVLALVVWIAIWVIVGNI